MLVPALELAYHNPAGTPVTIELNGRTFERPLREDGWLEVPIPETRQPRWELTATDSANRSVSRTVRLQS